jgi:putative long chain acyl-CoA synthase
MDLGLNLLTGIGARAQAAARNALEVARFGGLDTGEEPSPMDVVWEHPTYRLRRYFPSRAASTPGPPILLVPPMMLAADVYDVSPDSSAVRILAEGGVDPWVVDFGAPEDEEGGLDRTLTDHVLAVSDAVDQVIERTGRQVHLSGYSQGGMFCYQTAAYRRGEGVDSVITFGSPVDTHGMIPFGLPEELTMSAMSFLADRVLARTYLPAWASRTGFRMLDPAKSVRQRIDFVRQLHDRDALLPRERQRRFLQNDGWVAWPGPALAELMQQIVAQNRMLAGGFVIEDRSVTLADLTCPLLCFVGDVDEIARPAVVRAVRRAAPRAQVYEANLHAGHFGLVVGSTASTSTWPTVAEWMHWRDGTGEQPASVHELPEDTGEEDDDTSTSTVEDIVSSVGLATNLSVMTARALVQATRRSARVLRGLAEEAVEQIPRLNRLERVRPSSRISLGQLLDEQAAGHADDTIFLFEDRGHTYGDANRRIDNVVRGLVSLGVRQGEHVGVLMATRPSALTVVAAVSRLGAVAVLLRPDGALEREAELGQVRRVVCDPERAADALEALPDHQILVLGGGGGPRDLGALVVDMERIDPEAVQLPGWYKPNPGQARDLAFVLFTGDGERTRLNRITNGRWALSAFGTASAASLSRSDTVYGVTPLHHPSGLLTTVGGAVAGGARLAMARSFEPDTFWDEVRRYGVTVTTYTWTLVHDLVNAPPHPLEAHHPVRLFIGSGMPSGLWRRVQERFAPAHVLEFYASTEGEAVLANLTGRKIGSKGRPLPGSAEVRIARYDTNAGRLLQGPDGFALTCGRGEVGMLLARAPRDASVATASPLRGVFAVNDAWLATGDLCRRDNDGDYWLVDHITGLVRTASGPVATVPVEDALMSVLAVDLAAAYGLTSAEGGHELLVVAVTLQAGQRIDIEEVSRAVAALDSASRPNVVRVVDDIPRTTWHRLLKAPLRAEGLVVSSRARPVWFRDPATGQWARLTAAARREAFW